VLSILKYVWELWWGPLWPLKCHFSSTEADVKWFGWLYWGKEVVLPGLKPTKPVSYQPELIGNCFSWCCWGKRLREEMVLFDPGYTTLVTTVTTTFASVHSKTKV